MWGSQAGLCKDGLSLETSWALCLRASLKTLCHPGNKQIFSCFNLDNFRLLSNLYLILNSFQRGHRGTLTAFESLLLNQPQISSISSFKQRIKQLKLTLRGSIPPYTTRLWPGDKSGLGVPGCSAVSLAQRSWHAPAPSPALLVRDQTKTPGARRAGWLSSVHPSRSTTDRQNQTKEADVPPLFPVRRGERLKALRAGSHRVTLEWLWGWNGIKWPNPQLMDSRWGHTPAARPSSVDNLCSLVQEKTRLFKTL